MDRSDNRSTTRAREYEISHRTGVCFVTQRTLNEEQEFYAVLFEKPEGFDRRDYSLDAWQGPPEGYFCYWKSRVPKNEEKKKLLVDNDVLINLFIRLEDTEEPVKKHFRFVLALILMRKRLLKYESTTLENEQEYWRMRRTGEDTRFLVLNPRLTDEQIEAVSKELGAILHGDSRAFAQMDDTAGATPAESQTQES